MAGLWAYSEGDIYCPYSSAFLIAKPYLPQGSLLTALAYRMKKRTLIVMR